MLPAGLDAGGAAASARRRHTMMIATMMTSPATPPMTPPMMAPVAESDEEELPAPPLLPRLVTTAAWLACTLAATDTPGIARFALNDDVTLFAKAVAAGRPLTILFANAVGSEYVPLTPGQVDEGMYTPMTIVKPLAGAVGCCTASGLSVDGVVQLETACMRRGAFGPLVKLKYVTWPVAPLMMAMMAM